MRVLLVGAGGVGTAFARIAARHDVFEHVVVADYSLARSQRAAQSAGDRFEAVALDASDETSIAQLLEAERCDVLMNAVDPRFVMPLFRGALAAERQLPRHGDVPVAPSPGRPVLKARCEAGRRAIRVGIRMGRTWPARPSRDGGRARIVRRLRSPRDRSAFRLDR